MTSADTSQKVLSAFLAANPGVRSKSASSTNTAANSAALSAFLAANPRFLERSGPAGAEAESGLGTQLGGTSATDALRQELEALVNPSSDAQPVQSDASKATESKKPEIDTPGSPSGKADKEKPAEKAAEKLSPDVKVDVTLKPGFALLPESEILKNLLGVQSAANAAKPPAKEALGTSSPAQGSAAKPASAKASPAPVAKGNTVAKDAAAPQSPKKERTASGKDATTSQSPGGKQSPVTVAWKPKVDEKAGSPKREGAAADVKPASPKKDGRSQAATVPKPVAKDTGKTKQPEEVSEKPQGQKKAAPKGQDGILSLLESAFAKFDAGGPAAPPGPRGDHEYSVAELLRFRSKTRRLRELPYRVLAAKTDGELLEVPQPKEKARRAEKPAVQQKPVSRADKPAAPAVAQNGSPKRDKLGADTAVQKKPAEKYAQSFVWKPKAG
jgi:hypothetical protein